MFFLESNIEINVHGPLAYHHHNKNNNFSYYNILFIVTQLVSYFFFLFYSKQMFQLKKLKGYNSAAQLKIKCQGSNQYVNSIGANLF